MLAEKETQTEAEAGSSVQRAAEAAGNLRRFLEALSAEEDEAGEPHALHHSATRLKRLADKFMVGAAKNTHCLTHHRMYMKQIAARCMQCYCFFPGDGHMECWKGILAPVSLLHLMGSCI